MVLILRADSCEFPTNVIGLLFVLKLVAAVYSIIIHAHYEVIQAFKVEIAQARWDPRVLFIQCKAFA